MRSGLPASQWRAEHVDQRPHAAPADERHDDVDRVGRRDLGAELMADSRLAGRVREDRRVEQRRERPLKPLWRSIRQTLQQRDQHTCGIESSSRSRSCLASCQRLKAAMTARGDSECLVASLSFWSPGQLPGRRCRRCAARLGPTPQRRAGPPTRLQAIRQRSARAAPRACASSAPRATPGLSGSFGQRR